MRQRPNSAPNIARSARLPIQRRATGAAAPANAPARNRGGTALLTTMGWLLVISNAVLLSEFIPDEAQPDGSYGTNVSTRVLKLVLLAVSAMLAMRQWAALRVLLGRLNRFFVIFLVLVPLSTLWSISPGDTVARYVTILSIVFVWIAVCIVSWEPQRFQKLLRPVITAILIGSIIFAMTYPDLAIEHGEGTLKDAWRGLTSQKNSFGQLSSFGFILWIHGWLAKQIKSWQALLFGGCAGACVLFSRSSTSLLASLFVAIFLFLLLRAPASARRSMPYLIAGFATLVLTYAVTILKLVPGLDVLLRPIMSFTGKDMTFSNRSVIWDIIKEHIQLRPILGSGYGGYWIGPVPSSPSYSFIGRMYFYPNESHNGYLEIVNDLGYVGLIVLIGYFVLYLRQALRLLRFDRNQAALYLAIFFQQAIINLSESCWLVVNAGVSFTVMTFATIALARSAVDQRAAQFSPAPAPAPRGRLAPRLR
jgi:exopolysaccharide production protein ExoQ